MAGFVQLSNALLTHYMFYPKFNGNTFLVYAYLTKLNNADYGYAFPTQTQAIADLGISDSTFNKAVKTLDSCGLITVSKRKGATFNNNVYYVHDPIESAIEFYAKYPEAKAEYDRKQETADKVARRKQSDTEAFIATETLTDWL